MKKQKGVTLVSLVVTIIVLIILAGVSINAIIGENGIITIAKQGKENMELAQIEEQTELNELYTQMEAEGGTSGEISYDAIAKLIEFKKVIAEAITNKGVETKETDSAETMANNIANLKTDINTEGTATDTDIIEGKTAWVNGIQLTGNMTNNGAQTASLNAGDTYTIPEGYHDGSGKIIANSLESQTSATAASADIISGKTAWVNGSQLTGNMTNNGAKTASLNAGASYTIPKGYHNGSGKITANSLESQTSATATAADIASGKTAWINGVKITGTRSAPVTSQSGSYTNNGAWYYTGITYSVPITFASTFDKVPSITFSASGQDSSTTISFKAVNVSRTGFVMQITVDEDDKFTAYWHAQA